MIGRIVTELNNIPLILETLYFGLTQTTFLFKIFNFIINKHKIRILQGFLKKPVFSEYTVEQDVFIEKAIYICRIFANTFRFFVGVTITFYAIFPFIEYALPLPGWFPFDAKKYHYLLYFYQLICLILNGYNHTSLDCINASLICMASAQFEILKNNLKHLRRDGDEKLTNEEMDHVIRKRVKHCVEHHNVIIKYNCESL